MVAFPIPVTVILVTGIEAACTIVENIVTTKKRQHKIANNLLIFFILAHSPFKTVFSLYNLNPTTINHLIYSKNQTLFIMIHLLKKTRGQGLKAPNYGIFSFDYM